MRRAAGCAIAGALAAAALLHAAGTISDRALDRMGLLSLAWILCRAGQRLGAGIWSVPWALALAGGLALLQVHAPDLRYMPWLLVVPANLALAWVFARGLLPGRKPVLLRLILLMNLLPVEDAGFRRFLRGQCALWSTLAGMTAAVGSVAMSGVAPHLPCAELFAGLVVLQLLWFLLSHHYAARRYGRPETWWGTARVMARPGTWSALDLR